MVWDTVVVFFMKLKINELATVCISVEQKLSQAERSTAQQVSDLQSEINTWRDKHEHTQASLQRKEDEIAMLSQKLAEGDAQVSWSD